MSRRARPPAHEPIGRPRAMPAAFTAAAIVAIVAGLAAVEAPALAAGLALVALGLAARRFAPRAPRPAAHAWIPWAWLVLFLVSIHKLARRSTFEAAQGNLSVENIVELAAYGAIAAAATWSLWGRYRGASRTRGVRLLFGWPAVAVASALWSVIPLFSVARAAQLAAPLALALLTGTVARRDPATGAALLHATLRRLVGVMVALSALGFVVRDWPRGRFAWPYVAHPVVAATVVGAALLVVLAGGRAIGLARGTRAAAALVLGAALGFGQTRSVLAATALATLAALWAGGRIRPLARYLGIPYYLLGIGAGAFLAGDALIGYLSRGQEVTTLEALNGRVPLWGLALEQLSDGGRWLLGYGYGAARTILVREFAFAGEAHNAWIEILLGTGLVGLGLAIAATVALGARLMRGTAGGARSSIGLGALPTALLVFLIVTSGAAGSLALPGFSFTLYAFLWAVALAEPARATAPAGDTVRAAA